MVRSSIAHSITAHNITGQYSTDYTNLYYTITAHDITGEYQRVYIDKAYR